MTAESAPLRFLVVDDNADIRELFVHMVERLGHMAHPASDGVEAIEALAVWCYDYMLLDLSMPRMSGQDVMRWLAQHPEWAVDLRVVVVSAWAESQRDELLELGAHAVLTKPLRTRQLQNLLGENPSAATEGSKEQNGGLRARRPPSSSPTP